MIRAARFDRAAAEVVAGALDLAGVDGHAHADAQRPQLALGGDPGPHRRVGRAERRGDAVAHGGEDRPAGGVDARSQGA